jgi:hypothetical protein
MLEAPAFGNIKPGVSQPMILNARSTRFWKHKKAGVSKVMLSDFIGLAVGEKFRLHDFQIPRFTVDTPVTVYFILRRISHPVVG